MLKSDIDTVCEMPTAVAARSMRRALLAGRTVYLTMRRDDVPEGFVLLGTRECSASAFAALAKNAQKAYLYVDSRTMQLASVRFAAAPDGYLRWGLSKARGLTILLGGGEAGRETTLQVLVFQKGRLIEAAEKSLPAQDDSLFAWSLATLLDEWRAKYPSARLVQAGPLKPWNLDAVEYIGQAALPRMSYRQIPGRKSALAAFSGPVALATAGAAGSLAWAYVQWTAYDHAGARFHQIVGDPIVAESGVDTSTLERSYARRSYMEQTRREQLLVNVAETVAKGVASIQGARIAEITVPAPGSGPESRAVGLSVDPADREASTTLGADRAPDFRAQIAMARAGTASGLAQSQDILARLAAATGMSLRLAHQGLREDGDKRSFTVEGFVHNKEQAQQGTQPGTHPGTHAGTQQTALPANNAVVASQQATEHAITPTQGTAK